MAKPRVITRAMRLLEDAVKVSIDAKGTVRIMGEPDGLPGWGHYAIIPLNDADNMVSALARADARETRDDPSTRKRKAKA